MEAGQDIHFTPEPSIPMLCNGPIARGFVSGIFRASTYRGGSPGLGEHGTGSEYWVVCGTAQEEDFPLTDHVLMLWSRGSINSWSMDGSDPFAPAVVLYSLQATIDSPFPTARLSMASRWLLTRYWDMPREVPPFGHRTLEMPVLVKRQRKYPSELLEPIQEGDLRKAQTPRAKTWKSFSLAFVRAYHWLGTVWNLSRVYSTPWLIRASLFLLLHYWGKSR
ncbi:hypothetical protein EJ05DRAFT_503705 [Pseudovirgaria hyperparasitica]|uniref:Uncharacterized protein n=1 Tax=Pseudovirgaria hyperparasitica TaxID=470096 RepID=A0A6A6VY42_9PEZI|nr:uncharacterized protein EJ05DRAFT_503705 [Pseudovirgaria hyperparasitica]KAF2754759.1 hypothetical protein EJ05DRAFT_503705 [Pseudovirgaria hyperparasitica]